MGKHAAIKGLYAKRGWWYWQPPTPKKGEGPRPAAVALGTKDMIEAITTLDERRNEMAQWQASRRQTLDTIIPKYCHAKREDALWTRRQREMVLPRMSAHLGNPRVDQVTTDALDEWRDHIKATCSPATLKTYTIVAKAFFNWCVEQKSISENPLRNMKRLVRVTKTRRQEFLTEDQRETLLATPMPDHIRFILMFGFFTGLREGEMLAMTPRWIWISNDKKQVTVQNEKAKRTDGTTWEWRPKTRELRSIPMHPRLLAFVLEYKLRSPWMLRPDKELWPAEDKKSKRYDGKKALSTLAKSCKIPKLNFHIQRHSFATHLAMKGVPLAEIAGLLGDSLKVTEETYAGYAPGRKNPLSVL